jgi:hypothetical protein
VKICEICGIRFVTNLSLKIMISKYIILFSTLFVLQQLCAQDQKKYIYLEDPTYAYIDYLINAGKLSTDFALRQPYDTNIFDTVPKTDKTAAWFKNIWQYYYKKDEASFQLQARDALRYRDSAYNRWALTGGAHFFAPHVTVANRTAINQDYKHDPQYAGDLSESDSWLWGRVNDAYIQVYTGHFDLFFGRIDRNWGPLGSSGLILSNHPYSYDHFLFSYTYKILRLSLIFGRLEDLNAQILYSPGGAVTEVKAARKFLVGHRIDLSFSKNFQIALTEMATYGGAGRDFEFSFLNPINFYYGIQRNDRKQMDGNWSLDIFYKPHRQITLYGQFLIDDIIVNNEPGQDDRARFPDRLGISLSARSGDWLFDGLNLQLDYVRISNRTYQSKYSYENYHYRGLGLGYPCAGCEEVKFKWGYWGWFPFFVENEAIIGRYGDVRITDLFPLVKEDFPLKPVTNNMINTFKVRYFASRYFQFYTTIKYSKEENHYSNRIDPAKGWQFNLGFRLTLATGLDL